MTDLKIYTRAQVANECKESNGEIALLIIEDKVYNVTRFLSEHPGGEETLLEFNGKESTEAFNDVGHSMDAKELLKNYLVGMLEESEKTSNKKESEKQKKLMIIAGSVIAIGVGVIVIYKFVK